MSTRITGPPAALRQTEAPARIPPHRLTRDLGIPGLPGSPWGTHFCQFYRTGQDLLEVLVPYLRCGLEHNEFCLWVTSDPLTAPDAVEAMRAEVPGFDEAVRQEQIEIIPYPQWYLQDGRFDRDRVLARWVAKLEAARARGYDGLRLTGNTFWLGQSFWRDFADHEGAVSRMIGDHRMIALCTYSLDRCGPLEVIDVVMTHQFALVKQDLAWTVIQPSERRAAAEAVEKTNEALVRDLVGAQRYTRSLIEASLDPLVTIGPSGTITDVNAATEQVTGYSRKELIGTEFSAYFTEPDRARAGYERVFREGTVHDYALELRHRDGYTTPVLYNAAVYRDDSGQVLGVFAAARDVTELRRAEREIRAASSYNRSLIEASLDPLVTISSAGKITDVNEATVRATGMPREELIGSDFADYFTEPEKARAGYRAAFHLGTVTDYPLVLRHVSGATVDVHYNAGVYRDHCGQVLGVFAAARDVTARNRAEASALRLAAIVESSDDAIISKTLDGTILTWNPGAERLYGYPAEEIVGRPVTVLVPPDRHEELQDLMRRVARGEHVAHVETRRLPRQGPPLDISLTVSPLHDRSGRVIGVSTIARDITERKQAERKLRAASAYNRSLIEASLDPLVTIEPGGAITDVNAATEQATGCSRQELIGTEFSTYFTDPDLARAGYERVFRDGTVHDYALQLRHRDGHTTPVLYNASVYRDDSGQVLGVFAAARDITAQRAAEAEVLALNADLEVRVRRRTSDLEQATRNMEAFTYSVSHDLRAPLRALSGFSEALLEDYSDLLDDEGRDYARRIANAAQRMAQLIDDLLHVSRVSRAEMHLQRVDLSAEVTSIAEGLRRREPQRSSRFLITAGIRATADPQLIRTVLENLVGNAWKFTSQRAEAVIEFGCLPAPDAEVCCFVRDNGAGFDATYVDKLFQPFQRLHTNQQFPGNGIGLVSARRIVERHGGRTWAQGQVDQGATVYFTLNAGPKDQP